MATGDKDIHEFIDEVLRQPKRIKGVIVEVCDCCGQPLDSEAHIKHCRA